jgi:hypothetical protein
MNTTKQRRYLKMLCFGNFFTWAITTFPLIVNWYVKGGLKSGGLTSADTSMVWQMFIFYIIPTPVSEQF